MIPVVPYPCNIWYFSTFSFFAILVLISLYYFNCNSLIASDTEYLFKCLLIIWISSFLKYLNKSSDGYLKLGLLEFFSMFCRSSVWIFMDEMKPCVTHTVCECLLIWGLSFHSLTGVLLMSRFPNFMKFYFMKLIFQSFPS